MDPIAINRFLWLTVKLAYVLYQALKADEHLSWPLFAALWPHFVVLQWCLNTVKPGTPRFKYSSKHSSWYSWPDLHIWAYYESRQNCHDRPRYSLSSQFDSCHQGYLWAIVLALSLYRGCSSPCSSCCSRGERWYNYQGRVESDWYLHPLSFWCHDY